jgi:class 3 adenylate cyclase
VLSSYQPLQLEGINWVILSEINVAEVYAPIYKMQRHIMIGAVILMALVTVTATMLSAHFTRPINLLMAGVQRVGEGEQDVKIDLHTTDEFGALAQTFNHMVDGIAQQTALIERQNHEIETLFSNILPHTVAERIRKGERYIVNHEQQVTVLFGSLDGMAAFAAQRDAQEAAAMLSQLIDTIDDTVEHYNMTKLKAVGQRYMAVCGLSEPRLDHTHRAADFALAVLQALQYFNQQHNTCLRLRIGIHSGPVMAGVMGRDTQKLMYDVWGETVKIASDLNDAAQLDTILISHYVYERLGDRYTCKPGDPLELSSTSRINTWILAGMAPILPHGDSDIEG